MTISRRQLITFSAAPFLKSVPSTIFDTYWQQIVDGFLRNARKTSSSFAVCDFPSGTILKASVGKSGKTYDSVTRMLPALVARRRQQADVLRAIFRHAFDPEHPDYWLEAPADRPDQRQVESSLVAWSLWLAGEKFVAQLSSAERANIQAWLASCTRVPVRRSNWAWFTAVNQAARLSLSEKFSEFSAHVEWMLEDLNALDGLAAGDGWYTDSRSEPVYDYYNFWSFASHYLYWNRMVGAQYPEWSRRFSDRLRTFLEKAPYFFAANGSQVLFGRSLIYRWAVLTPLVLAYQQRLWPHSPGLLRRIVRLNLAYHWDLGAFDAQNGKLRETFSEHGTPDIREPYIDNGHPYWSMQAFALFLIPRKDPFWTAPEEPLPVEHNDFRMRFDALQMMLVGTRDSGHVRWFQSFNVRTGADYRDKYTKFSYSSHFPFNILKHKDQALWDNALVFRHLTTGACVSRDRVRSGRLTDEGLEIHWRAGQFEITTHIVIDDEFERRTHIITAPSDALNSWEAIEGSYALGLALGEEYVRGQHSIRSPKTGHLVAAWNTSGYDRLEVATVDSANIIYPKTAVLTLRATLKTEHTTLASRHYASPNPVRHLP